MEPPQYTSTLSKTGMTSKFPIRAHFLELDTRFKKGKPLPSPNSFVAIQGFLSRVEKLANDFPVRFHIDLDHVTFLGRHGLSAQATGTKVPRKCLIIYFCVCQASHCFYEVPTPNGSGKRKLAGSFISAKQFEPPSSPSLYRQPVASLQANPMHHDGDSPGPSQTPSEGSIAGQTNELEAAVAAEADDDNDSPLANRVAKRHRTERER